MATELSTPTTDVANRARLIDGLIPSAGFVSLSGFYMLRGTVPRAAMVAALFRTGNYFKVLKICSKLL